MRSSGPDLSTSVAGANAPAFVERSNGRGNKSHKPPRVAGANAPAFVER